MTDEAEDARGLMKLAERVANATGKPAYVCLLTDGTLEVSSSPKGRVLEIVGPTLQVVTR